MIWKYHALSRMGKEHRGVLKGDQKSVYAFLNDHELSVISINSDYSSFALEILLKKGLSNEVLSSFFKDFARMTTAGMTAHEIFTTLSSTATETVLRDALLKVNRILMEGGTLRSGFAVTEAFSPMVVASIDAAEKSGNLLDVLRTLAEYYKFRGETQKRVINALGYPVLVFIAMTVASIIISTKLIPPLKSLLPETALQSLPTQLLLGYAWVMEHYWWFLCILPFGLVLLGKYIWKDYGLKILEIIYSVPRVGTFLKELELAGYFMSLGVYLKSGVVLNEAISNMHKSRPTYMTQRFVQVRDYVLGGMSFWSAVERDSFFPSFVHKNIRKGEEQGRLKEYVHDIYRYYEDKSRETIDIAVSMIHPILLFIIVGMVAFLVFAFFVPLYSGFGNMADQVYK